MPVLADERLHDLLVATCPTRLHLRDPLLGGLGEVALEHAAGGHRILAAALACSRAPTRRTSTLGFSLAVWASAATATIRTQQTTFEPLHVSSYMPTTSVRAYCILTLLGTRQISVPPISTSAADPDPRDQREDVRLNHGALVVVRHAAEIQVEIFVGPLRGCRLREVPCRLAV